MFTKILFSEMQNRWDFRKWVKAIFLSKENWEKDIIHRNAKQNSKLKVSKLMDKLKI